MIRVGVSTRDGYELQQDPVSIGPDDEQSLVTFVLVLHQLVACRQACWMSR